MNKHIAGHPIEIADDQQAIILKDRLGELNELTAEIVAQINNNAA